MQPPFVESWMALCNPPWIWPSLARLSWTGCAIKANIFWNVAIHNFCEFVHLHVFRLIFKQIMNSNTSLNCFFQSKLWIVVVDQWDHLLNLKFILQYCDFYFLGKEDQTRPSNIKSLNNSWWRTAVCIQIQTELA